MSSPPSSPVSTKILIRTSELKRTEQVEQQGKKEKKDEDEEHEKPKKARKKKENDMNEDFSDEKEQNKPEEEEEEEKDKPVAMSKRRSLKLKPSKQSNDSVDVVITEIEDGSNRYQYILFLFILTFLISQKRTGLNSNKIVNFKYY